MNEIYVRHLFDEININYEFIAYTSLIEINVIFSIETLTKIIFFICKYRLPMYNVIIILLVT